MSRDSHAPLILIEIDAVVAATGAAHPLRFCASGTAWRTLPTETPASVLYRPRVLHPGDWRVEAFDKAGSFSSRISSGDIRLNDADGKLGTEMIALALAGRGITIRRGFRDSAYPSGFTTLLKGRVAAEPNYSWGEIRVKTSDRQADMATSIAAARYAGSGGFEGGADLKAQVKPLVLANALNMTPRLVDQAKQIYQVSAGIGAAAVAVSAPRDGGVPLASGGAYAALADLQNDALKPASSQYKSYSSVADGCWFRLGSTPIKGVTCDAAYGAAADRTAAQVAKRILLAMGVASGDIAAADVTALDAAQPGEVDCLVDSDRTAADVLNEVLGGVGAWWVPDTLGVFRMARLEAPAGSPVATLKITRAMAVEQLDTTATGEGSPAWRVKLSGARNYTVQRDGDLNGDKTSPTDPVAAPGGLTGLAARAWLAAETRSADASDAAVKSIWPNAADLKQSEDVGLPCSLTSTTALAAEAARQLALYKVRRDRLQIEERLTPDLMALIGMGAVVNAVLPRWDYQAGRSMRVLGIKPDALANALNMTLWG